MMEEFEEINKVLKQRQYEINNSGLDDFEGYSPSEMRYVLYDPMSSSCIIQFANLEKEDLDRIPLLRQVKFLGELILREGKLKLTSKGYLPTKIVKELYSTGLMKDNMIEAGISKLYRENECLPIHLTHIVARGIPIFSKTKGLIKISKKGENLLKDGNLLLRGILETCLTKYNWAYFDGYSSESIGRLGALFSLMLLNKYGNKERTTEFYSDKYLRAFPFLIKELEPSEYRSIEEVFNSCYEVRTFDRFLKYLGIIDYREEKFDSISSIKTNDLFSKLVKLKPHQSLSDSN